MSLRITILGCGSSGGVPRVGGHWGACDPANPKNRRRRCSILVQKGEGEATTSVLVDTSPDMREQLLDAEVGRLDAVIYTHDHADQSHGIDDLRMIAYNMRRRLDVHMDDETAHTLMTRFGYCFAMPEGSDYPPILNAHLMRPRTKAFTIDGPGGAIEIQPFDQDHGTIRSLGFRFGSIAYSPDLVGLPEASFGVLEGVECWIVDALRYTPHPTHAHVDLALEWIERVKPERGILTNMHIDLDYETLKGELPAGVEPAYDGMVIEAKD